MTTEKAVPEIYVYGSEGRLVCGGNTYRCVVGNGGVVDADQKKEGDGATPAGTYPLRIVHYRPDKLDAPTTGLPVRALEQNDGWSDDQGDPDHYNQLVKLPYNGSHEEMWRSDDDLYDLVVEIGWNDQGAVPGKGSAIFMHVAQEAMTPTAGCVALAKPDLLEVLKQLGPDTTIVIYK